jgi:peptide/nickel transport system ATP-binding protein
LSLENNLIVINNLKKYYPVRTGLLESLRSTERQYVRAVDDVSFNINSGEIYGLAGESGCGKTTTGRLILRLLEPTDGTVQFKDRDVFKLRKSELKEFRRRAQIIYQDPYESLDPRMTIFDFVAEPLIVHKIGDIEKQVEGALERAELTPAREYFYRFPHELSGGQRQRVAIARAMILNPEFMVADEPVSMLDVSIRTSILNLMMRLRDDLGISYLYITHDLATAKHICDRIGIMYLGKLVEEADVEELVDEPLHPYTQALIAAVPDPDPSVEKSKAIIIGEVPNPTNIPSGCRFHTRCPKMMEVCMKEEPELIEIGEGHRTACHLYTRDSQQD